MVMCVCVKFIKMIRTSEDAEVPYCRTSSSNTTNEGCDRLEASSSTMSKDRPGTTAATLIRSAPKSMPRTAPKEGAKSRITSDIKMCWIIVGWFFRDAML